MYIETIVLVQQLQTDVAGHMSLSQSQELVKINQIQNILTNISIHTRTYNKCPCLRSVCVYFKDQYFPFFMQPSEELGNRTGLLSLVSLRFIQMITMEEPLVVRQPYSHSHSGLCDNKTKYCPEMFSVPGRSVFPTWTSFDG